RRDDLERAVRARRDARAHRRARPHLTRTAAAVGRRHRGRPRAHGARISGAGAVAVPLKDRPITACQRWCPLPRFMPPPFPPTGPIVETGFKPEPLSIGFFVTVVDLTPT